MCQLVMQLIVLLLYEQFCKSVIELSVFPTSSGSWSGEGNISEYCKENWYHLSLIQCPRVQFQVLYFIYFRFYINMFIGDVNRQGSFKSTF